MNTIPIFPLKTVLYPEGILPLRIFEPRYLDLVKECVKNETNFGICLIREGQEVSSTPADVFAIGTTAKIIDWYQHDDGVLGITVEGQDRFRLITSHTRKNNLMMGDIEYIDHDDVILPAQYQLFSDLLRQIIDKFEISYESEYEKFNDSYWVGCRLAELLPVELNMKQVLLEIDDPLHRLVHLQDIIADLDSEK